MTPTREPAGPSLAELLAVRGRLSPGEVVTLGAALALALAELHDQGLAGGGIGTADVRFTSQGQPVVTTRTHSQRADTLPTPAEDLAALGALLRSALPDRAPPVLRAVIDSADVEAGNPDGRALARRLLAAWPAAPIAFAGEGTAPTRRRGRRTAWLAAGLLVLLLMTAVATALRTTPTSPTSISTNVGTTASPVPSPTPRLSPSAAPTPTTARTIEWSSIVRRLDALRAGAFAQLDRTLLRRIYVPGSPPWTADATTLTALRRQRLEVTGLHLRVLSVSPLRLRASRAVLRVVDRRTAYDLVGPDGTVVAHRHARGPRDWRVTLVRSASRWLVSQISTLPR